MPAGVPSGAQVLARMAAALAPSVPDTVCDSRDGAGAGLHVTAVAGHGGLHVEDDLWAAIEGYPRWGTESLARMARTRGHAAALAAAYRHDGEDLFRHLAGPFSLAVIEPQAGRGLLAIDRFGVHTMCYGRSAEGGLVFGATTQAVRAHPGIAAAVTAQGVYDFLLFYVCPAPRTIYRGIDKLLPAQFLMFENGTARTGFYWQMPYRDGGDGGKADAQALAEELDARLEQAVRRTLAEEDPGTIGAFLSGGLDSTTVVGMARRVSGTVPRTFTVVFEHDRYDESRYARAAAAHYGARYNEYALGPRDALELIPRVAATYDEPFGNSSVIPAYCCARMAAGHGVGLLLAGDGGDELFGGNERYVEQLAFEAREAARRRLLAQFLGLFLRPLATAGGSALARRAWAYLQRGALALPDRLEADNYWFALDPAVAFTPAAAAEIDRDAPLALRREVYRRTASTALVQRMMHLDLTAALADNDLRKVNRMTALAGVRVRYPFLDEDLAEFSARIPPEVLVRDGQLRDFFKRALKDFLPPETLAKEKHGFGMPFEEWLKDDGDLRALAHECLAAFKHRGYLQEPFLDRIIADHARSRPMPGDGIVWDIMILELWLQAHEHPCGSA